MLKQLKAVAAGTTMALAVLASAPVSAAPAASAELVSAFWNEEMMKRMDRNKDGKVARQEFLDYMAAQYDKMDVNKDKMLDKKEFMDKKMMSFTFPASTD